MDGWMVVIFMLIMFIIANILVMYKQPSHFHCKANTLLMAIVQACKYLVLRSVG